MEVEMGIDLVFKIAAIGIIVAVLDQVLRNANRNEMATLTSLAGLVVVLVMVVQQISGLFKTIKSVFGL
jgi:stage III sporulation protein AC